MECTYVCVWLQAERVFSELRRVEPQRVDGLDIYSTVLWHLQSEVALSALAQDVTEFDKLSSQVTTLHAHYVRSLACFDTIRL